MKKRLSRKNEPATQEDLELLGGNLAFQIDELRQESKQRFDKLEKETGKVKKSLDSNTNRLTKLEELVIEIKKSVDQNTEATVMLTQEFRELKHIEFQVYNHENRIKRLEESR